MSHEPECPMASCLNEHPENFLYIPSCNCSCICDELRAAYQRGAADEREKAAQRIEAMPGPLYSLRNFGKPLAVWAACVRSAAAAARGEGAA